MRAEEPQRRLVGWKQYGITLLSKGGLYSSAGAVGCVGFVFLTGALLIPIMGSDSFQKRFHPDELTLMCLLFLSGLSGALFIGAMWASTALVNRAKKLEAVAPLTRKNAGHLPEAETLVRGSEPPQSAQKTELLRPAEHGSHTPTEQLLRVGQ